MPTFFYTAKKGPSEVVNGVIEADDTNAAVSKVMQLGLTPLDVIIGEESTSVSSTTSAQHISKSVFSFFKRVRLSDIVMFTRQMSDMTEAAVPLLRSLQIAASQTKHPKLKIIIQRMYERVRDGGSFSSALAMHEELFSQLYVNMVKTGEVSGQLEHVLNRLADYLEKEQETQSKIRSSLAYPFLILVVGVLTVFVLLSFVIPRLSVMFEDLGQTLPLPTIILMSVSGFFAQFWWLILAACAVGGVYVRQWISTERGRIKFDTFKLKLPVFGEFLKVAEVGRFARTLGTLVESGVTITTALNSVWPTIENSVLREEIKNVAYEVANGSSLKASLQQCSFFPEVAVNMISVGEETGRLDRGLHKIADSFERQADQSVKTFISLLGPIVLVVIVAIVGFVVIAMLLPIFQMNLIIE